MTTQTFESIYGEKGGVKKLTEMRDSCATLKSIGLHFGVSKTRVGQWMKDVFGEQYDRRAERRNRKIEAISLLIKRYGLEKTKKIYKFINKYYLLEAIKLAKTYDIKR